MPDVKARERANGLRLYVIANQAFDYATERGVVSFANLKKPKIWGLIYWQYNKVFYTPDGR